MQSPRLVSSTPIAWLAPLAIFAVVLAQFWPVAIGRVYRFEDIAAYFEPLFTAAARAMRAGHLPLWDGGAWSGQPIAGDPQAGLFYPPNWLWLALPVLRAYAVLVAAHALFAGLGMYALCRARGRSPGASAMAGIALGAGGYVVLQTRHIMFVEATAWVPWVAVAALAFVATRSRLALAGTAAATGMLLLTGGVSMIYYAAWFLLALVLPAVLAPANGTSRARLGLVFFLGLAVLLGLALAAPSLLAAAAHGRLSPRALGTDEAFSASVSWGGFRFFPSLFVPNLLGQEVRGNYFGGGTQWEIAGYYTGLLPFALALGALVFGARERRAERFALASIFVLAILLAPGLHSPVHGLACRVLPLYASMRCPPRALYVFSLGIPLLAADGLDLVLLPRLRPMLQCSMSALVPALVALDLLVTHRAENPSLALSEATRRGLPQLASVVAAATQERGDRYINDVHLPHALHNSGLLWGAENASGYSSLPLFRYLHYLWIANHGAPYPHARLHDDLAAQGIWRMDSPLLDALDVRFVLASRPPEAIGFVLRQHGEDGIDLYENREALPRARFVHAVRLVDGEPAAARALADSRFDPKSEVILEDKPDPWPAPAASPGDRVERAHVSLAGEGEVAVHLEQPAILLLAEPFHPGRHATVDGQPAHLLAADYALTALPLAAGDHAVRFAIRSRPVEIGLLLAALAGLVTVALGLFEAGAGATARRRAGRRRLRDRR